MNKNTKFFLLSFIMSSLFWWGISFFQQGTEQFFYAQITQPFKNLAAVDISARPKKQKPDIKANSVISIKVNKIGKERMVFGKNINRTLPIASLSKLMTALIVMENTRLNDYDLSKTTIVSQKAASQYNIPIYGNLKAGQIITIEQLLKYMLYYSSNDAAFTLAEVIGLDNFVAKMNQKSKELGLNNTYFINPTGLDPNDIDIVPNYSTVNDLANLSKYVLSNHGLIFEFSLENGPYLSENGISGIYILNNQIIVGGKTGYTEKAGGCVVFVFSDENGNYFINILLGAESPDTRIEEIQKLINWINS
ncbi:MAG: serine hydrolase [Patescibacteria group bacterium]|nr:serine hydrolase [Patescibacteria group bacterium]